MDKLEKIKAEIQRRLDILYPQLPDAHKVEHEDISLEQTCSLGKYVALESLADFINSLPEEPVKEYEAEINYWNQRGLSIRLDKNLEDLGFEEGDKVKITIIKEE